MTSTEGHGGDTLPTDRRTRDRVRLFFWAVLTIVCISAVLVSHQQQQQGLRLKAEGTQERAIRYTENVLDPRLDAHRVASPIQRSGYDQLLAQLKRDLFTDQRIVRVRVWRPDGLLVFTTDDPSKIGALTSKDPGVHDALQGDVVSVIQTETVAPDTTTTPVPTELFSTYVPLRDTNKAAVHGVVEIDSDYGLMRDATSRPWKQMQVAFGIVGLLCFVMTIVSFVWSRRPEEVSGFGPNRRDARVSARDDKKAASAQAEAAKLRERVKELEQQAEQVKKEVAAQKVEQKAEQKAVQQAQQTPPTVETTDPAETERLTARAKQLEAQAQSAEARSSQLQARVTEMEAQLRVTTEQLRSAQKRQEEAASSASAIPPEVQAQLQAAGDTEQVLRAELQAAQAEVEGLQKARDETEQEHAEQAKAQQGQLDQARAQARMAEEERQRSLAEAAQSATVAPAIGADVAAKIDELEQQLKRSEHERAMLRAGRPETVYEARNRELEDELAQVRDQLRVAEDRARSSDAATAGVDPGVIAALEERISAAEERARDAEHRLDEAKPRGGSRSRTPGGNGNGEAPPVEDDAEKPEDEAEKPAIDGSELRSRLVRSTDAKRRGATPVPEDARSSRAGRPRR